MKALLFVMLGGGLGSGLRYLVSKVLNTQGQLPWGTFTVNILGSLLIGFLMGWAAKNNNLSESQLLFLATGFCGGFTTFSAFALEGHNLFKADNFWGLAIYIIGSLVLGVLAVFAGLWLAKTQL
ncbi:MAG: fluoride efflux transporter CrcB [Gilvibacter sp.]